MQKHLSIKHWANDDKPREKLLKNGIKTLSDAEILTILIGTGTKQTSALDISKNILQSVQNNLYQLGKLSIHDLKKFKGIGEAKAISIAAALELGRRRNEKETPVTFKVTSSKDAYEYILPKLSDINHEEFWVAGLNRAGNIIQSFMLSKGGLSATVVDVKIICKNLLDMQASSALVFHNHPSGNLKPSDLDKNITQKVKQALTLLEINLLDHIIVTDRNYFSFADEGIL